MAGGVLLGERHFINTAADYGYIKHKSWVDKSVAELEAGTRWAFLAQHTATNAFRSTPAGIVVFRPNEDDPSIIDIRNFTVPVDKSGKYFGAFLLNHLPHIIAERHPIAQKVRVDAKLSNVAIQAFFGKFGYRPDSVADLYDSGKPDMIMIKDLDLVA